MDRNELLCLCSIVTNYAEQYLESLTDEELYRVYVMASEKTMGTSKVRGADVTDEF